MLTFIILAAVTAAVTLLDLRRVFANGHTAAIIFYCVLTAVSLIIMAMHSFGVDLPGVYGF